MALVASDRLYGHLCVHGTAAGADPFDLHVAASILTIAMQESRLEGISLSERTGLDSRETRALFMTLFPGAMDVLAQAALHALAIADEESSLRDILWMNSAEASMIERLLARMIARRCMRPNHLWQDLGLGHRRELNQLMRRHFPRLAERNNRDMKWKKFFYRMMCSSTGYSLCLAPVCSECDDFDTCFGPEDGEAILARIGNGRTAPAMETHS